MTSGSLRTFAPCHELKCVPPYYQAVSDGRKTFEVRLNDRDYKVGDTLWIREYDPDRRTFTSRFVHRRVTYVLTGGQFGIEPDYVVMGLE